MERQVTSLLLFHVIALLNTHSHVLFLLNNTISRPSLLSLYHSILNCNGETLIKALLNAQFLQSFTAFSEVNTIITTDVFLNEQRCFADQPYRNFWVFIILMYSYENLDTPFSSIIEPNEHIQTTIPFCSTSFLSTQNIQNSTSQITCIPNLIKIAKQSSTNSHKPKSSKAFH